MTDAPTPTPTPAWRPDQEDDLALAHLGLAAAVAREYRGKRLPLEDLEAEARLALVEAAREFDPEGNPGVPFERFAEVLIRVRLREALYRAPVVRMSRDRERAAMRGEIDAPRPHDTPVDELGVMPPPCDAGDDERAIADALRHCTEDERELVGWMLRGCTVAEAGRRMHRPLHEARALFDGARGALTLAFAERGYSMPAMSGTN